uniref:Uncharacterized protein n=1 Tax=Anopheles arabiensis TaxID=7173 RepID=A0A453YJF3_ANOAR
MIGEVQQNTNPNGQQFVGVCGTKSSPVKRSMFKNQS